MLALRSCSQHAPLLRGMADLMEVVTTALLTPLYWCGLPELHRPGLRSLRRYPHWLPHVMVGAPFDALAIRSAIVVPRGPFLSTARLSTDRATLCPKEAASSCRRCGSGLLPVVQGAGVEPAYGRLCLSAVPRG